jgi:digeranylgeranylglycerophospholipid reductase
MDCDVLVIGAGPTGCCAAMSAAKNGAKVVTVEKKFQITSPLRGGEAVCKPFYDELLEDITCLKKVPRWENRGTVLQTKYCTVVSQEEKWKAYLLERRSMERVLYEEAANTGAEIMLGSEVLDLKFENGLVSEAAVRTYDGIKSIKPKIVIAADGFASLTRKLLNINKPCKDWASAIEFEMVGIDFSEKGFLQVFFMEEIPGGYSYIFSKTGGRGLTGVASRPLFDKVETAISKFNKVINKYEVLSRQLKNATFIDIRGGCIDVSGPLENPVRGNIALVGDAANHNFAYIGEGLIPSMVAAKIAGEKAAESISDGIHILSQYPVEYKKLPLWRELVQTLKIKDNIDDLIYKNIDVKLKLVLEVFLEMEVFDWTGKELPNALKYKSTDELIRFGKDLASTKNMSLDIRD